MRTPLAVVAVVAAAALLSHTRDAAAQTPAPGPLVETPASTAYQLETVAAPQVKVPLTVRPGVSGLAAELVSVTVDGKERPSKLAAFSVALAEGALAISVRFELAGDPGLYGLALRLTGTAPGEGGAPAPQRQLLALQLQLAPGKLREIPKLTVTSYRHFFFDPQVTATIALAELSRLTGLTNLRIEQLDRATANGAQIDARLTAPGAPTTLGRGARADVALSGTGFPIGTTTGRLTITAPELPAPISVDFEIRSERYSWLILPWFIFFGIVGWAVRSGLKKAEARAELRARLEPLRAQFRDQKDTHPEDTQVVKLAALDSAVDAALKSGDHDKLEAATLALRTGLEAALAARAAYTTALAQEVLALDQALAPPWRLPGGGASLAAQRPRLAQAQQALIADRPKLAAALLAEAYTALDDLGARANLWRDRAARTLAELAAPDALARTPAAVRAQATAAIAAAQQKLAAVPRYDPAQRPAPPAPYLRAVHELHEATAHLAALLYEGAAAEVRDTMATAKQTGMPAAALDELAAAGALPPPAADPLETSAQAASALRSFAAAVDRHVTETEARDHLAAGRYAEAVRMQAVLTGRAATGQQISSGPREESAAGLRLAAPVPAPELPAVGGMVLPMRATAVDPVALARRQLQGIRFVRSLVAAGALSLVTWALYRGTWTGSTSDLVGIAVLAFFTDFTLDAVIDAVRRLPRPA